MEPFVDLLSHPEVDFAAQTARLRAERRLVLLAPELGYRPGSLTSTTLPPCPDFWS